MSSRLLTVDGVAEYLAVAPKTVYQNWRWWGLRAVRIGGGPKGPVRFRSADVEKLADSWEID